MRDKNFSVEGSVLESAPKQSEIEVAVRGKNESVTVFVLNITVGVTRLLLSSGVSLLVY